VRTSDPTIFTFQEAKCIVQPCDVIRAITHSPPCWPFSPTIIEAATFLLVQAANSLQHLLKTAFRNRRCIVSKRPDIAHAKDARRHALSRADPVFRKQLGHPGDPHRDSGGRLVRHLLDTLLDGHANAALIDASHATPNQRPRSANVEVPVIRDGIEAFVARLRRCSRN
jgi:hypothetical protein